MRALPDDVEAALTKAIGAYLRATPAQELPASLRKYQNFRPKALTAHRRTVLDALDTDGFRGLVREWLDDRPNLPKREQELLKIAVEREDGWEDALEARAVHKSAKPQPAAPDVEELLAKERAKTAKAREDVRRTRAELGAEVKDLQAQVRRLQSELESEKSRANAAESREKAASAEVTKVRSALERDQRKARSAVEKAQAAAERAREDLKDARRSLQQLTKEMTRTKEKKPTAKRTKKSEPSAPTGPRRPLPVPKGRFEDDPHTLEAWLANESVHLLVDGYNATMSDTGFGNLDLEGQRSRLVDEIAKLARRTQTRCTVVFDGADVSAAPTRRSPRLVKVQYSAPNEIADDYVIALLESMPPHPVVVATNDRELQERARALGATIATSDQLLAALR